jgi:tRNA1(Val) A37 N6-methylase TrmN6
MWSGETMSVSAADRFMQVTPREILQHRGQFWTPGWVARAMASYVLENGATRVFDPAVGAGALLLNARRVSPHRRLQLAGFEIDPVVLALAGEEGFTKADLSHITIASYLSNAQLPQEDAILCNPPYIRHHRLDEAIKLVLREELGHWLRVKLDGRLGLHAYFFLRSLQQLRQGGRLAYITSADLYEGKSSHAIWTAIAARFRIDGVVTFETEATPFPTADTNPVIVLIAAEDPARQYRYIRVLKLCRGSLEKAIRRIPHPLPSDGFEGLFIQNRNVAEHLEFGIARPRLAPRDKTIPLGCFIRCMRGIGTGANNFFLLTESTLRSLGLPRDFFVRAVARTRDVPTDELTQKTLADLTKAGRPTWLLNLHGYALENLPVPIRDYLAYGMKQGLTNRPLIKQRPIWYWVEQRVSPPFFFAYLGRRHVRFIRNKAGAHALTGFLYVYPQSEYSSPMALEILWQCMKDPKFLCHLELVAKTYGGGALKVEPRALERTPIPIAVVEPLLLKFRRTPQETQLEEKTLICR